MTTITHAQHAAALAAAQDAPDAAAALRAIADAWGVTLPEPETSEEMVKLAREIAAKRGPRACYDMTLKGFYDDRDSVQSALAGLQFAVEKARELAGADCNWILRSAFLASIGAGHAR